MEEIISLRVGNELRQKMRSHEDVNWSSILRKAIEKELLELAKMEKLRKQMDSDEEKELMDWSVSLGKKAKKERFRRFLASLSDKERKEIIGK